MRHADYKIGPYEPDQLFDTVKLLQANLWQHSDRNTSYFQWKYHDNPYVSEPLGVVATKDGKVVGFRGYTALNWYVGDEHNRTTILVPGDTVVDHEHRRKGLSVAMGKSASERFATKAQVFLNMTAGKNSVPGYLRMGFVGVQNKAYFEKCGLAEEVRALCGIAMNKAKRHGMLPLTESRIQFGEFGDVLVSRQPFPDEMSRLASCGIGLPAKITLLQDRVFFRWRYANPRGKYVFYFVKREQEISAFLVMKLSEDNRRGFIVDFGQEDEGSIAKILSHIVNTAEFDAVSILNISVQKDLWKTLKPLGFSYRSLRRTVKRVFFGEFPILVRPVKQDFSEADWFLSGLDIRRAANWRIKPISSDSA